MSTESKPAVVKSSRFRWMMRFSLRTFFVLLTILCVAGWYLNRVQRQRAAVKALTDRGAIVSYDVYFVPPADLPKVQASYTNLHDESWAIPHPRPLSEDSLLGKLKQSWGIHYVATAKGVWFGPGSHRPNLRPLKDLSQLHEVILYGFPDQSSMKILATLPQLRYLNVSDRRLTDINFLSEATQLRVLYLSGTSVQDVSPLARMTNLELLSLSDTPVRNIGPLSGLVHLKSISLYQTQVTDITPLHRLSELKKLNLMDRNQVSDEGRHAFSATVPDCKVWFLSDPE